MTELNRNSKCPLCGSRMTDFHDSYSDGDEVVRRPLLAQQCVSNHCGLPVRLWEKVAELKDYELLYKLFCDRIED